GPLGLGLAVDRDGRLLYWAGEPSETLWARPPWRPRWPMPSRRRCEGVRRVGKCPVHDRRGPVGVLQLALLSVRVLFGRAKEVDYEPRLVDCRAPAAQPFYRATAADSQGVVRRRHLLTHGREVVGLDDEVFDLDALSETEQATLHGDAALLAALRKGRTGRMGDIVATIQAEQDKVIRSDVAGVLVVEGGPGTGKTAVALHRAAYLLYTH